MIDKQFNLQLSDLQKLPRRNVNGKRLYETPDGSSNILKRHFFLVPTEHFIFEKLYVLTLVGTCTFTAHLLVPYF